MLKQGEQRITSYVAADLIVKAGLINEVATKAASGQLVVVDDEEFNSDLIAFGKTLNAINQRLEAM